MSITNELFIRKRIPKVSYNIVMYLQMEVTVV